VKPRLGIRGTRWRNLIVAMFCALALPMGWPVEAREGPPLTGWLLVQRNKTFGHIQMLYCPGRGVRFRTSIVDGCLVPSKDGFALELINEETKKYKVVTPKQFSDNLNIYRTVDRDYKTVYKGIVPGAPILGFPTKRIDYALRKQSPPFIEFPDHLWATPKIQMPKDVERWLRIMIDAPDSLDLPGFPLRIVQTKHLGPTVTEVVYDTFKIEHRTFKPSDFAIPPGYKQTQADGEVFNFGIGE
jgi:hypothetical protein